MIPVQKAIHHLRLRNSGYFIKEIIIFCCEIVQCLLYRIVINIIESALVTLEDHIGELIGVRGDKLINGCGYVAAQHIRKRHITLHYHAPHFPSAHSLIYEETEIITRLFILQRYEIQAPFRRLVPAQPIPIVL